MNPQPSIHRPPYAPARGLWYWRMGVAAITIGLLVMFVGREASAQKGPLMLTGVALLLLGVKIWYRGKQYSAKPGEKAESDDGRPPIIYLRSFSVEVEDMMPLRFIWNAFFGGQLAKNIPTGGSYEKEELKRLIERIGPFITVGRPGEPFSDLGAARLHLSNEEWQEGVESRLRRARLVVVRAGRTDGLGWEIKKLVSLVRPKRILFLLPVRRKDYAPFQQWVSPFLPKPLPAKAPKAGRLLTFDEHWNAVSLSIGGELKQSLAPFFAKNGISLR